ncbi:Hypothetical protein IALB_1948 [Ignavibacterium album JCM 16511]|uniref:Uncharacterized protein n=1 Tax=Ignavibacterium album (strain DSM 19864 / JCM 16511 / NBRC 101810 / Mat9-16) TaxID=945713 RepID=I0AKZ7_IGNAJ|nr:Hypothetical protein IALB_1948 [Ignavibacterium album JCM 16511]
MWLKPKNKLNKFISQLKLTVIKKLKLQFTLVNWLKR